MCQNCFLKVLIQHQRFHVIL